MQESVNIGAQSTASVSCTRRYVALYSMILMLSASTIFCVVKSMTLPADVNEQLMRAENTRIDKQLESSLAEQQAVTTIPLPTPAINPKTSIASSKHKQSKPAPVAAVKMQSQTNPSVCEQNELKKLQANFRGGQWDE